MVVQPILPCIGPAKSIFKPHTPESAVFMLNQAILVKAG